MRKRDTGIGHTLEQLMGLEENNFSTPDFGTIELKSRRESHSGLTTLFTLDKNAWKVKAGLVARQYGHQATETRGKNKGKLKWKGANGLYGGISTTPNTYGIFSSITDDQIHISHIDGTLIGIWGLSEVSDKFKEKMTNTLLVTAKRIFEGDVEYFHYVSASILHGSTTVEKLKSQLENRQMDLEIRIHDNGKPSGRNHGTAFRVNESNLANVFSQIVPLNILHAQQRLPGID